MKLLSATQMQALDRRTIEAGGIPGLQLMERAGLAVAFEIESRYAALAFDPVLVLAGRGNNGGDGTVIARALQEKGWQVQTLVVAEREQVGGDARVNLDRLDAIGATIDFCPDTESLTRRLAAISPPALIVDALLGTGLSSEVHGPMAEAIHWVNRQTGHVVAVDIPSGVHGTTGRILGAGVQADLTVTFGHLKPGLLSYPGAACTGDLKVADIGFPERFSAQAGGDFWWADADLVDDLLPEIDPTDHKGSRGHLLVVAGSRGKTGAAGLASMAGLRAGAGLVTLACPESIWDLAAGQSLEVMTEGVASDSHGMVAEAAPSLLALAEDKTAMVLGPGLGQGEDIPQLLKGLIPRTETPLVIDADGLNALVGNLDLLAQRRSHDTILTPHPGEMARLTGLSVEEVQAGRLEVAQDLARQSEAVVVLKGARTVIAAPDGRCWINGSGNPALATAGTGDVLAGAIGSLLAQGIRAVDAAVAGVFLHGAAADSLAVDVGARGLIASDLLNELPRVRARLMQGDDDAKNGS